MAAITLKNIPENLYRKIKKNAKDNLRSMNNEMLFQLKLSLETRKVNVDKLIDRIEKLHKTMKMDELTDDLINLAKSEGRS